MKDPWYRKWFPHPSTPITAGADDEADATAQFNQGLRFASEGALQDYPRAAEWYRKAADQGHSLAQFNLGVMYAQGQGLTRDDAQAVVWFDKAARHGDGAAQFNMGKSCYRASLGRVPAQAGESRIEAYKWFQLAAAQGYRGAEAAQVSLILGMTREEVAEGNLRAAGSQFEQSHPSPGAVILSVIPPRKPTG